MPRNTDKLAQEAQQSIPFSPSDSAVDCLQIETLLGLSDTGLYSGDMTEGTRSFFTEMIFVVVAMKDMILPGDVILIDSENISRLSALAELVTLSLKRGEYHVRTEIDAIQSILQLAPFTIRPGVDDLWMTYQQMAELIIQRTNLPCHKVLESLHRLYHIYNASVYVPVLSSCPHHLKRSQNQVLTVLDSPYDAILGLIACYHQWMNLMEKVSKEHTRPCLARIVRSPEAMRRVEEAETCKTTASGFLR